MCNAILKHALPKLPTLVSNFKRRFSATIMPAQMKIGDMLVKILPILEANYSFMVVDLPSKCAISIDPACPEPTFVQMQRDHLNLEHVLITHHHEDHQAGNATIKECYDNMQIYGGDERIQCLDHKIKHYDTIQVGNLFIRCLHTPGHTKGHYSFLVESTTTWDRCIFVGDLIFSGGIGPISEGTAAEMYHSLQTVYSLPDDTRIFGCHEFTKKNLEYAAKVEPCNKKIAERLEHACAQAAKGLPPIVTTVGLEKQFNPFMRVTEKKVQEYCGTTDPYAIVEKMATELYPAKNSY